MCSVGVRAGYLFYETSIYRASDINGLQVPAMMSFNANAVVRFEHYLRKYENTCVYKYSLCAIKSVKDSPYIVKSFSTASAE